MTGTETILPPQYEAQTTEAKWQEFWQNQATFQANPHAEGESYAIVIPPPNVTGKLHMGHAFNTALIDTLIRYHRMSGKNTLCLPGTDHASIAVQTIIEKQLKAEGKTRYDLGRDKFLDRAWQWRQESGGAIVGQLKRLGLSADWSRERFTLDENLSYAVKTAFMQLYEEGLIYRGNYMVNWCPESQSAVSDLEVENKEVDGHLWHFRYPLSDGNGFVEVATTRPETMLGDTAVAVNPNDDRYRDLIGKMVTLPITFREIPIIGDEFVDPSFGTGCVKVTPAHDYNDFEMGKRHSLPFINILNKDGTISENGGFFAGQDRFQARNNVVNRLKDEGLLVEVEKYRHSVPYSDRGKVPVEPLISTQWFVKIEPLAEKALSELDNHDSPHFVPERWQKVYRDWLVKLKDWCISRQLWWGHQIPAWYIVSETNGEITENTPFVVAVDEISARDKAFLEYGEDIMLKQDPDVLDTWFSSGLWPFSTMGWPNQTEDLTTYFPNATMVTGFDIIFFWVARMTMMSGHFTGKMPFKDVYIHGLVRDENGKKMSKSANNGVDPLLLCDRYGADALRYTLIREVVGAGQDITLQLNRVLYEVILNPELEVNPSDEFLKKHGLKDKKQLKEAIKLPLSESVEASRNFANKLWNASRFVLMNLDGKTPKQLGYPNLADLELSDRWILSRFNQTIKQTHAYFENYGLGESAKGLYEFIWGDFCDWYIELVKSRLWQSQDSSSPSPSRLVAQQTLAYVLEGILKLLHPFMPHITEEIWHTLTQRKDKSLALQKLPQVDELLNLTSNQSQLMSISEDEEATIVKVGHQVVNLLDKLPDSVTNFAQKNKNPLLFLLIILPSLILLQLTLSILAAIHEFPLFSPLFRLIGLIYTFWFSYKNLLYAQPRKQTLEKLASVSGEIFGSDSLSKNTHNEKRNRQDAYSTTHKQDAHSTTHKQDDYPTKFNTLIDNKLEQSFSLLFDTIKAIRNLRAEAEIKQGVKVDVILQSENLQEREILAKTQDYIQELGKVKNLTITDKVHTEVNQAITKSGVSAIASVVGTIEILIPLTGVIDIEKFRDKLSKKLDKLRSEVKLLEGRLNNASFVDKAPLEIIQNTRDVLTETQIQIEILQKRLELLN